MTRLLSPFQKHRVWRGLLPGLGVLGVVATAAPSQAADDLDVQFTRTGLRFTAPCTVSSHPLDSAGHAGRRHARVDAVMDGDQGTAVLPRPEGPVAVVVTCESTEGPLRGVKVLRTGAHSARLSVAAAFVLPTVVQGKKEREASVSLYDATGIRLARGGQKTVLVAPTGRVFVEVETDDSPVRRASTVLTLRAGKKATPRLDVSDAQVTVRATDNGRGAKASIMLRQSGSRRVVAEFETGDRVTVPPGVYDVVSQLAGSHDAAQRVQKGVQLKARARRTLTVKHQSGAVMPRVRYGGRGVQRKAQLDDGLTGADVDIELYKGEAPQPFTVIRIGERVRVEPGAYRVRAVVADEALDDGSPWAEERTITVKPGGSHTADLDLSRPTVDVTTVVGGTPARMRVELRDVRTGDVIRMARSSERGQLRMRLPAGQYQLVGVLNGVAGPLEADANVTVRGTDTRDVDLALSAGRVMLQVFDLDGVAVAADVLLYKGDAARPAYKLLAGEEVWIAEGAYRVWVNRRGHKQGYGTLRVASGRTIERKLQLGERDLGGELNDAADEGELPEGDMPDGDG